jgi:hypothetical protein
MEPVQDVAALEKKQHQEDIYADHVHENQEGSNFGVQSEYECDKEYQSERSDRGGAACGAP